MGLLRSYAFSLLLGGGFIWLAFKDEDWAGFLGHLETVETRGVLLYVCLFAIAHGLRILRWGALVNALGDVNKKTVFAIGAVGYMAIMILPFRLGEFVRPYLIKGQQGITASGAMATVIVERVVDGLIFVGLFFVFLSILPPSGNPAVDAVRLAAFAAGGVFFSALCVLVAGVTARTWTVTATRRLLCVLPERLGGKIIGLLEAFLDGLVLLPSYKILAFFLGLTGVYWGALGVGMHIMAQAVGIEGVSVLGAFALLTVLTVGIMVPAGPGFTGTFELALKAGFALLIIPESSVDLIAVYAIVLHFCQLLVQVGFGLIFLGKAPRGFLKAVHK